MESRKLSHVWPLRPNAYTAESLDGLIAEGRSATATCSRAAPVALLAIAVAAVDGSVASGSEGHLCVLAALGADCRMHLTRSAKSAAAAAKSAAAAAAAKSAAAVRPAGSSA